MTEQSTAARPRRTTAQKVAEVMQDAKAAVEQAQAAVEEPVSGGYTDIAMVPVTVAAARVAAEIGHIAKVRKVTEGPARYNFRGIDDVFNAIHEPMARHGVMLVPTKAKVLFEKERATKSGGSQGHLLIEYTYRLYGPMGDWLPVVVLAEALDTSDKGASKSMSMAYKYAAFQVFSIPIEGAMEESDSSSMERGQRVDGEDRPPAPAVTLADVHNRLRFYADQLGTDIESLTGRFRKERGDLTMDAFWALPLEVVFPYARAVADHANRVLEQRRQQEAQAPAQTAAPQQEGEASA